MKPTELPKEEKVRQVEEGLEAQRLLYLRAAAMGCAGNLPLADAFDTLESKVDALREQVAELREHLDALAQSFARHQGN